MVGPGGLVRGDLLLTGNLIVHGRVEGVVFTDGEVWIGPDASIEGGVHARHVTVEGTCRGFIEALAAVHLREGAVVHADVDADDLRIEFGARFTGRRIADPRPRVERWRDASLHNA